MRYFFDVVVPSSNSGIFTSVWGSREEAQSENDKHGPARCRYVAELEIRKVEGGYSVVDVEDSAEFTLYAKNGSMAYSAGRIITPLDEPYYTAIERLNQVLEDRAVIARIDREHAEACHADGEITERLNREHLDPLLRA